MEFLLHLLEDYLVGPAAGWIADLVVQIAHGGLDRATVKAVAELVLNLLFGVFGAGLVFLLYRALRSAQAPFVRKAKGDRITIAFADFAGDPDGKITKQFRTDLAAAFGPGLVEIIETKRLIAPRKEDPTDQKLKLYASAHDVIERLGADVLVMGRYEPSKDGNTPHRLYLTPLGRHEEIPQNEDIPLAFYAADFTKTLQAHLADALAAVVVATLPEEVFSGGRAIAERLRPIVERLGAFVSAMPTGLTWQSRGSFFTNYANACHRLALETGDPALLEQAIAAYREVLKEWTRERVPLRWAGTQNNLGAALNDLSGMPGYGTREELSEQAVAAYREALKEWTRERVPFNWAMTQNNLGNALADLGRLRGGEEGDGLIEQAITAYREALKEWTRERVPLDWAIAQNNLGAALADLGRIRSDESLIEQAVEAYREALKERTRERVPLSWAMTQNNLGNALANLGRMRADAALVREAIQCLEEALAIVQEHEATGYIARIQKNLDRARAILAALQSGDKAAAAASLAALPEAILVRDSFEPLFERRLRRAHPVVPRQTEARKLPRLPDAPPPLPVHLAPHRYSGLRKQFEGVK